jgi:hypothetical protein
MVVGLMLAQPAELDLATENNAMVQDTVASTWWDTAVLILLGIAIAGILLTR